MFRLEKVEGPPCPECECTDSEILETAERTGTKIDAPNNVRLKMIARSEHRRCNHCGTDWWIRGQWEPLKTGKGSEPYLPDDPHATRDGRICPECGAGPRQTKATTTRGGIQHRKCKRCGTNFKNLRG
jgi:Zn ribbon nucleic-acid-binding protein